MNGTLEKKTGRPSTAVLITAILCMTALELFALSHRINGTLFALSMGLIGAVAGVGVGRVFGLTGKRRGSD